jgi:hypothetical protein
VAVVVVVLLAGSAATAAPVDSAAVNKVTNLNRQALEAYNKQEYEKARELLKQALEICSSAGLEQHPITARTHIHFGVLAIVGFNQREAGLKQFRKALEIEPQIKLTRSLVTPDLQAAFDEAVQASKGGGGESAAGGEEGGVAPSDQGGESSGEAGLGDEGGEAPRRHLARRPHRPAGDEEDIGEGAAAGGEKGSFFLGVTVGSGAGIASGSGHLNPAHKLQSPGFAPGQLGQVEPQVGYFLSPTLLLSLAGRLQYVSGTNGENGCGPNGDTYCTPTTIALAAFLRATWLFSDSAFHFTVGGQLGGGYVAHAVKFPADTHCGTNGSTQCVDALLGGPLLIGPTAGIYYDLGKTMGLMAAVDTALGVSKFTFNVDIDVGLAFRL